MNTTTNEEPLVFSFTKNKDDDDPNVLGIIDEDNLENFNTGDHRAEEEQEMNEAKDEIDV